MDTGDIENQHMMNETKFINIKSYRNQALIGTFNLIIGIVFTGFMIFKNKP
jgi:hypothetical protein|tara:strand:+ start:1825 stop:1977 length:153 start_codon:yes stop_codon:yes gene_type:complete